MIGIKTWLYNLSKTKIYIPKTLTSEVYDSVGGTSLDQIIEKNNNNISDVYNDQKTYAVGDYCIYNNSLYKCITEITTAESFNSAKWKLTSISDILGNTNISSIGDGTVTGGISTLDDSLSKFLGYKFCEYTGTTPSTKGTYVQVDLSTIIGFYPTECYVIGAKAYSDNTKGWWQVNAESSDALTIANTKFLRYTSSQGQILSSPYKCVIMYK